MGSISSLVRQPDGVVTEQSSLDAPTLARDAADASSLLWLDVADPDSDALALLESGLGLHPLALEDLRKRRQRTKLDTYPGQYVIVAHEAMDDGDDGHPALGELHLIATSGALVSIHWGESPAVTQVRRLFANRIPGVADSTGSLLYTLLDSVADAYPLRMDRLSERIDGIEERIMAGESQREALAEVLAVKRQLLELRRVISPLRDVANALLRRELEVVSIGTVPYYQDLYDHLVRVLDSIDLYRDILASALDANLALASNSLNQVVKRLTALTVILMVPTLITGIYGMNFRHMPELAWPLGYAFALGLMFLAVLGAVAFFRWRDWL
jgi:magnesium transporter